MQFVFFINVNFKYLQRLSFRQCFCIFKAADNSRKSPVSINTDSLAVTDSVTEKVENNSFLFLPEEFQGFSVSSRTSQWVTIAILRPNVVSCDTRKWSHGNTEPWGSGGSASSSWWERALPPLSPHPKGWTGRWMEEKKVVNWSKPKSPGPSPLLQLKEKK